MALPDLSTLSDVELRDVARSLRHEQMRRSLASEAERVLDELLRNAKAYGVTKPQAVAFLARVVNAVYDPPPEPEPETPTP